MHNKTSPHFFILGLARSGLSTARFLHKKGLPFTVWDDASDRRDEAAALGFKLLYPDIDFWKTRPMVILSPGIPHNYPAPHPLMAQAIAYGCHPICDVQLFFHFFPHLAAVGITGSFGKSTTCALLEHILRHGGTPSIWVGNGGMPIFSLEDNPYWIQIQQDVPANPPLLILELSSYQLELCTDLPLQVGALLNISDHHLERHGGLERYTRVKQKILDFATKSLVVAETPNDIPPVWTGSPERGVRQFVLAEASISIPVEYKIGPQGMLQGSTCIPWPSDNPMFDLSQNRQNLASAFAICQLLGLSAEASAVEFFRGLPHRQERVGCFQNIIYVNDSKATTPKAAASALHGIGGRIFWIVGGVVQEDSLTVFLPVLSKVEQVFVIGEAWAKYETFLQERGVPVRRSQDLTQAVQHATVAALKFGKPCTILLSPGCASFDAFRDFEHRGEAFRDAVQAQWNVTSLDRTSA